MSRGRTPVKDTYSTHDVARICCVTPTTVIRWIEDGLIPAFKTVGGHRRVRREDLERVCQERGIPFTVPTGDEVGRLLVIDDEPVVLDLVRDVLKDLSHQFDVEVARDAFDAGRLVATFRPQLIFLDLMMPGVDGFEVCARLKRDASTMHTEIIAITGYYTEANMERILAAGASACLKKPLDVTEVRRRVVEAFHLRDEPRIEPAPDPRENSKVLLVTQNADFRAKVKEELERATPPLEIKTAQTGADALLVAQAAPPRYVILSMTVPDLKSTDVIAKLAAGPGNPQIIAVHDAPTDEIRMAARAAGARMCLPTAAVAGSVRELLGV
ncbi:DNA binding domain-containing protein, excisionase family [Nannocystis exedens]|uniref:DNA binding domain-containing protein, excisionase family n=1 Tax=Nannocystis exedens TaxID=54 RepID=A0A1I1SYZ3_9BACT|nr:response regulator [Nannocystis exedens]PCC75637.1 DNA-binding response regulator, merR family protein [Nannocystis exedens]SFD48250.1 DNA binding domain-containing protein, excisionase family [Nannocystis exedens]